MRPRPRSARYGTFPSGTGCGGAGECRAPVSGTECPRRGRVLGRAPRLLHEETASSRGRLRSAKEALAQFVVCEAFSAGEQPVPGDSRSVCEPGELAEPRRPANDDRSHHVCPSDSIDDRSAACRGISKASPTTSVGDAFAASPKPRTSRGMPRHAVTAVRRAHRARQARSPVRRGPQRIDCRTCPRAEPSPPRRGAGGWRGCDRSGSRRARPR